MTPPLTPTCRPSVFRCLTAVSGQGLLFGMRGGRIYAVIIAILFFLTAVLPVHGQLSCPIVKMQAKRLPELNIPRSGHSLFVVNGEPTVVGGHTSSFVPTATAEYFSHGEWHLVPTAYPHDHGFSIPLSSGQVMIGGGHAEPLGIGHTYSVEMYDADTHSFHGFGCLCTKRCFSTATEMDSGRVAIAGNWYQSADGMELFDGQKYFMPFKGVSQSRSRPFVLRISQNDAIVFSSTDEHGHPLDTIIIDRLRGEPFLVPLLEEWKPLRREEDLCSRDFFIGDEKHGRYVYLMPVENKDRQVAICRIDGTHFSLLATDCDVPMELGGVHIRYNSYLNVDQQALRAYLVGCSEENGNVYVLAVDYSTTPASLKLYYSEQTPHVIYDRSVLTPDGDLLLAGGVSLSYDHTVDHFSPHAITLLLPMGIQHETSAAATPSHPVWLWIALGGLALAGFIAFMLWRRARRSVSACAPHTPPATDTPVQGDAASFDLMQRLHQLMEEQKPYLNSELKVQDVADALGTNRAYVSNSIRSQRGCSFSQFVNAYRIEYAQQLLRQHPDKKISEVSMASGFSTESSFFRAFKAVAGMAPKEWIAHTR